MGHGEMILNGNRLGFVLGVLLSVTFGTVSSDCPNGTAEFHRLGKTKYFVYDKEGRPEKEMDTKWSQAQSICQKLGADATLAANLDKITTNAIIAKNLEILAKQQDFQETVYWIGGKYDPETKAYQWTNKAPGPNSTDSDSSSSASGIQYSNFHYQQPHPCGIGDGSGHASVASSNSLVNGREKCLAFALPFKGNPNLGWQASWAEKDCDRGRHRRVLCETANSECQQKASTNPHVLTEDKEYYFTEGNWIFSNRKFIVNWKPRTFEEAKSYCESMDLELYAPVVDDDCLIPQLKMWAAVLSTYHFWTSYKYNSATENFLDKKDTVIQRGRLGMVKGREVDLDESFCVSYVWGYEFRNETRCEEAQCNWMYYMLAPSSCRNRIGTICQHKEEDNMRTCNFQPEWTADFSQALSRTALVEFGYKNSGFWRSTYKQTFGSRICGHPDRQMIGSTTEYWDVDLPKNVLYPYDYEETYWVVDEDLFQHVGKNEPLCSVSKATLDPEKKVYTRELQKVNCNEWHFYLCELVY